VKRTETQADRDKPFVLIYNGQMCRMLSYPLVGESFRYELDVNKAMWFSSKEEFKAWQLGLFFSCRGYSPAEIVVQGFRVVRKTWWRRLSWEYRRRWREFVAKASTKVASGFMMSVRR
jgi:hypothetical protein